MMSNDQKRDDSDVPLAPQAEDEVEYSDAFAAMILAQEQGDFEEIDPDDLLALLERMLIEARNGK
jgi:hypothetical protein